MTKNLPIFPKPLKKKSQIWCLIFKKKHSFLDGLYSRCYSMKMGVSQLLNRKIFLVNQLSLIKEIFIKSPYAFPKHKILGEVLAPLLGESIFTTNGTKWTKQRDMVMPAFKNARVDLIFNRMQDAVNVLMKRLDNLPDNSIIDIDAEMTLVTADIIFRTIMSSNLESRDAEEIFHAFGRFQSMSPQHSLLRLFIKNPNNPLLKFFDRKRRKEAKIIRNSVARIIEQRYLNKDAPDTPQDDILAALFKAVDPETGTQFSMLEITDQVVMLFLAGHETTAASLTWTIYLLSISPDDQDKVWLNILEVLGDNMNTPITLEKTKKLNAVENAFMESLRLYPPVGFFVRESVDHVCMRGKTISPGDYIVVSPWLVHRHQDYWERPNTFCPMRFDKNSDHKISKAAYFPFSMGPRACIGMSFAMRESVLILGTLLRKYRVEIAPDFEPEIVSRVTIRSANGMKITIKERHH